MDFPQVEPSDSVLAVVSSHESKAYMTHMLLLIQNNQQIKPQTINPAYRSR